MKRTPPSRVNTSFYYPDLYDTFEARHRKKHLRRKWVLIILFALIFVITLVMVGSIIAFYDLGIIIEQVV
jgi:hypothetical protein